MLSHSLFNLVEQADPMNRRPLTATPGPDANCLVPTALLLWDTTPEQPVPETPATRLGDDRLGGRRCPGAYSDVFGGNSDRDQAIARPLGSVERSSLTGDRADAEAQA